MVSKIFIFLQLRYNMFRIYTFKAWIIYLLSILIPCHMLIFMMHSKSLLVELVTKFLWMSFWKLLFLIRWTVENSNGSFLNKMFLFLFSVASSDSRLIIVESCYIRFSLALQVVNSSFIVACNPANHHGLTFYSASGRVSVSSWSDSSRMHWSGIHLTAHYISTRASKIRTYKL